MPKRVFTIRLKLFSCFAFRFFIVVIITVAVAVVVVVAPRRQGRNDQWPLISVSSLSWKVYTCSQRVCGPRAAGVFGYKCRLCQAHSRSHSLPLPPSAFLCLCHSATLDSPLWAAGHLLFLLLLLLLAGLEFQSFCSCSCVD